MEPKEIYEIYGDRPYVVFPCGAGIVKDKIYLTYGGADSVIGIAEMAWESLWKSLSQTAFKVWYILI